MKSRRQTNKTIWQIIMIISIVLCVLCLVMLGRSLWQDYQKEKEHESLVNEYTRTTEAKPEENPANSGTEPGSETPVKASLPVDFAALQAENPDIFAWILIPGTDIDYPVLQYEGEDQSYYLERNMYREKDRDGSIYIEIYNDKNMTDPNTLIYGHNWSTGGMFHSLENYMKQEFFDEHPVIYLYMPDRILTYEIFTSHEFDDRHLLYAYNFKDEDVFADYLETILHPRDMNAKVRESAEVTTADKIITLSTCVFGKKESRQLVQAVLVKDEPAEYRGEMTDAEE